MEQKLENKCGKARNWCFTWNNYEKHDPNWEENMLILGQDAKYLVYGQEIGEKGTPHLQGYIEWKNSVSFENANKKYFNNSATFFKRMGTAQQASDYCKKGEQSKEEWEKFKTAGPNYGKNAKIYEVGELSGQGKRTDIDMVREMLENGEKMKTIIKETKSFQAIRYAEKYKEYCEEERHWKPEVYWYYGPSESGKSETAEKEAGPGVWWSGKNLKWWQNYDGHENIIIEEFRSDFCSFHELLRILDKYPYTIEVKGGSRQLLAKKIWITSCFHPSAVYGTNENIKQLLRRITTIKQFFHDPNYKERNGEQKSAGNNETAEKPTAEILKKLKI